MTTVRIVRGGIKAVAGDLLVVPVEPTTWRTDLRALGGTLATLLAKRARLQGFMGKADESLLYQGDHGEVLVLGLGGGRADVGGWRRVGSRARREAERLGARRVVVWLGTDEVTDDAIIAFGEATLLVGYRFDRYRRDARPAKVGVVTLLGPTAPAGTTARALVAQVAVVAARVADARDLVNEPSSIATPTYIASWATEIASSTAGLTVDVWGPKRIQKEGLTGVLAVARGSRAEPRFVTMRWTPVGAKRHVALVGKGVTFDSGGLSLKPAKGMETMKYDMAGGAAVLGATAAAAALRLPVAITTYVPLTENLPGGMAQKPGDVIRYANGKSVEVLNTDAEGRLVLADALVLASRAKPDAVVDLATLTGAARIALGGAYAAVLGNDRGLVEGLLTASSATGEPLWELPLVREYRDDIRSTVADIKNIGGDAGTITAALFLEEFVEGVRWAHLDIAGPAFIDREHVLGPRGATAYGVRLLVRFLATFASA